MAANGIPFFLFRSGSAPTHVKAGVRSMLAFWAGGATSNSGVTPAATTNSGVQRLKAFHDGQDREAHYREVRRREALQFQQIRLAELQQQQREIEAKRIAGEALRKAAEIQPGKSVVAPHAPDLDDRITALVRELAEVTGAVAQTQAEIARLGAIEAREALRAEQAYDDETILILAASI